MSAVSSTVELVAVGAGVGLALVHLLGGTLGMLEGLPRNRWLSFSGGVSVAYVFVHLLHEVGTLAAEVGDAPFGLGFLERHAYLVALAGFVAYYGVERAAKRGDDESRLFWMHVGSFALYNVLVGYLLLHRVESGIASLLLFAVAMATHFVVNDWGLRDHHGENYHRYGRWVLAGAVLAGTGLGLVVSLAPATLALLLSFLAGGIVLNVIKEEVPDERESKFWAFAAGALAYTAILLVV